jgi:hypothetical protein
LELSPVWLPRFYTAQGNLVHGKSLTELRRKWHGFDRITFGIRDPLGDRLIAIEAGNSGNGQQAPAEAVEGGDDHALI